MESHGYYTELIRTTVTLIFIFSNALRSIGTLNLFINNCLPWICKGLSILKSSTKTEIIMATLTQTR